MAGAAVRWRRRSRRRLFSRVGLTKPDCRTVARDGADRVCRRRCSISNAGGGTAPSRRPPADHHRRAYHLPSLAGGVVRTEALRKSPTIALQSLTQQEVAHFAYPFGSALACAEREAALVAAGFRTAATARHGCVFPGHQEERYALPREGVQWHDDEASLACKSIGARRFLRDFKLGRPWRAPMATMAAP